MLPLGNFNSVEYAKIVYPNKTYRMDIEQERIRGNIDKREAIKQAIYKMLNTERYRYAIYDSNYGIELEDLFGKDRELVCALLESRIKDALSVDDRIIEAKDFSFGGKRDVVSVRFTAVTNLGSINMEVDYNV